MKSKFKAFRAAAAAALLTSSMFGPAIVNAAPGTLADSPLFLSNSVEPNVLFVLDDSGSMSWGIMAPEREGRMYSVAAPASGFRAHGWVRATSEPRSAS